MAIITAKRIRDFSPNAKNDLTQALVNGAGKLAGAGINTPVRVAHFMAQMAAETSGFSIYVENMNYSAPRLMEIFGSKFKTMAHAKQYANNPQKLANYVYDDANRTPRYKLGNTQPGDGWRYRGRGFIQLTGRDSYTRFGYGDNPDALTNPDIGLEAAIWEWTKKGCNKFADQPTIAAVTQIRKLINGGSNGLENAKTWFRKALVAFPDDQAPGSVVRPTPITAPITEVPSDKELPVVPGDKPKPVVVPPAPTPDNPVPVPTEPKENAADQPAATTAALDEAAVAFVQTRLRELKYYEVGPSDGDKASRTEGAILAFRNDNKLPLTPTIDKDFLAALAIAKPRVLTDDRTKVTEAQLRPNSEIVKTSWWNKILGFVGLGGGATTVVTGVMEQIGPIKDQISPIQSFFGSIPVWVWGIAIIVIAYVIWKNSQKAIDARVQMHREGVTP